MDERTKDVARRSGETLEFVALLYQDAAGSYQVSFPDLPGCVTAGVDLDGARRMAEDALYFRLAAMEEDGDPIPEPSSLESVRANSKNRRGVAILVKAPPPSKVDANDLAAEVGSLDPEEREFFYSELQACLIEAGASAAEAARFSVATQISFIDTESELRKIVVDEFAAATFRSQLCSRPVDEQRKLGPIIKTAAFNARLAWTCAEFGIVEPWKRAFFRDEVKRLRDDLAQRKVTQESTWLQRRWEFRCLRDDAARLWGDIARAKSFIGPLSPKQHEKLGKQRKDLKEKRKTLRGARDDVARLRALMGPLSLKQREELRQQQADPPRLNALMSLPSLDQRAEALDSLLKAVERVRATGAAEHLQVSGTLSPETERWISEAPAVSAELFELLRKPTNSVLARGMDRPNDYRRWLVGERIDDIHKGLFGRPLSVTVEGTNAEWKRSRHFINCVLDLLGEPGAGDQGLKSLIGGARRKVIAEEKSA